MFLFRPMFVTLNSNSNVIWNPFHYSVPAGFTGEMTLVGFRPDQVPCTQNHYRLYCYKHWLLLSLWHCQQAPPSPLTPHTGRTHFSGGPSPRGVGGSQAFGSALNHLCWKRPIGALVQDVRTQPLRTLEKTEDKGLFIHPSRKGGISSGDFKILFHI